MASVTSGTPDFILVGNSPLVAGSISTSFTFIGSGGVITPQTQATIQVTTTGAPTSFSLQVEVSLDNQNWYPMDGPIIAAGIFLRSFPPESVGTGANSTNPIVFLDNRPNWLWIRTRVTAVVGGTSPRYQVSGIASSKCIRR